MLGLQYNSSRRASAPAAGLQKSPEVALEGDANACRELLKPSASVALHRHSNALVDILPPEADSSISLLSQSERPDVTYQVLPLLPHPPPPRPKASGSLHAAGLKCSASAPPRHLMSLESGYDVCGSMRPTCAGALRRMPWQHCTAGPVQAGCLGPVPWRAGHRGQ